MVERLFAQRFCGKIYQFRIILIFFAKTIDKLKTVVYNVFRLNLKTNLTEATMTRQRKAILEVIRSGKHHYTAEELLTEVKKLLPEISRATVYNNLHALEGSKLIRRITAEDGSDRYDSSYVPHGHFYCTRCRKITDFEIPGFTGTLERVLGTEFDSYELKVRCVCHECRAKA